MEISMIKMPHVPNKGGVQLKCTVSSGTSPLMWNFIFLKHFLLGYMIVSCGWCMRYSTPCLRSRKAGSVGSILCPLRRVVRH